MNPVMYLFVNNGLGMSSGKIAAQAGHAAVEAYIKSDPKLVEEWRRGLHYTKLVLEARDTEHILVIDRYLRERGLDPALIIDEGRTEIDAHTPTALGVPVVDKDDPEIIAVFSTFKLLRPPKAPKPKKGIRKIL